MTGERISSAKGESREPGDAFILFSIVVAARNAAQTIGSTIESVLSQSCRQVEVVVVDGQSTDRTLEVLRNYQDNPKLRWISEPDSGIYDAMNKGILLARGRYLLFLGADDRLYCDDVLQRVADRIAAGSEVAVGNIIYSNGRTFKSRVSPLLYLLNTMHHQATFYLRDLLLRHPFDRSRQICADYELNLFLYMNGYRIQKVDLLVSLCGHQGVTKEVLLSGSLEEISFKGVIFGRWAYPANAIFVMTKYLVRRALRCIDCWKH